MYVAGRPEEVSRRMAPPARSATRRDSPVDDGGAPGEARAERDGRDLHAALQLARSLRLMEQARDGRGRGVAVALNVAHELLFGSADLLLDVLVDAQVG